MRHGEEQSTGDPHHVQQASQEGASSGATFNGDTKHAEGMMCIGLSPRASRDIWLKGDS